MGSDGRGWKVAILSSGIAGLAAGALAFSVALGGASGRPAHHRAAQAKPAADEPVQAENPEPARPASRRATPASPAASASHPAAAPTAPVAEVGSSEERRLRLIAEIQASPTAAEPWMDEARDVVWHWRQSAPAELAGRVEFGRFECRRGGCFAEATHADETAFEQVDRSFTESAAFSDYPAGDCAPRPRGTRTGASPRPGSS